MQTQPVSSGTVGDSPANSPVSATPETISSDAIRLVTEAGTYWSDV